MKYNIKKAIVGGRITFIRVKKPDKAEKVEIVQQGQGVQKVDRISQERVYQELANSFQKAKIR